MEIIVIGLATFRLVRLLTLDSGPLDMFMRIRERLGIREENGVRIVEEKFFAELLNCHWCMGIWVSLLIAFIWQIHWGLFTWLVLALAAAGLAGIIDAVLRERNL